MLFLGFQLGIRLWARLHPGPIPYGWTWLLENPWRKTYRAPGRTAEMCELKPTDTVLELGCGSGLFTRALAERCAQLIAMDVEPRYLEEAKSKVADLQNAEFKVGSALDLPLPDSSVDVAVLISVLPEIPDPVGALRECARVLKPGGRIVVSEELFEPEYVLASTVDSWARAAGLERIKHQGNGWVYFNHYAPAEKFKLPPTA